MHLKRVVKKGNKFFVSHFVIVDAIDGSYEYLEKLNIKNCWRYLHEIMGYIYWKWKDKKIQKRRDEYEEVS